jgi:hypothetical protein
MPKSLDPNCQVRIVLDSDQGKSPEPAFIFLAPTMRKESQLGTLYDRAIAAKDAKALFNVVNAELAETLVGWENMGNFEFGKHELGDIVSMAEALELARHLLSAGRLSSGEKKSSESEA